MSIEESLKYATCLGYQNVCVLDAVSGIKDFQTTTNMLKLNMPMLNVHLEDSHWKYNEEFRLYAGPKDKLQF